MKNTFPFIPSVKESTQSSLNRDLYAQSIDLYEEKKYIQAFHTLLDCLNPDYRKKFGNNDGTEFHLPNGSIVIHIRIEQEAMFIEADFLNLPEKGRVAMLRQVADLNINKLLLPRFVKIGDRLNMEYSCRLSETHPHKIYEVLQNICYIGDKYDDEFCSKFHATRCYEPQITAYSEETLNQIYNAIQTLGHSTLEAIKEYNGQRRYGYSWNILKTTFFQISYFACPQGQTSNDLDKAVDDMNEELPVAELVAKGTEFLEKLLAMPKEKILEDIYSVNMLISPKRPSSLQNIQENFEDVYDEATGAIQAKDFERAAVRITCKFYEAYFYNDMQDDINAVLMKALKEAGNKPFEEAANILYNAIDHIMEGELEPDYNIFDITDNPVAKQMMEQASSTAAAIQEKMTETMGTEDIQAIQKKMVEAMERGDMAEYMKLAGELQQKMMSGMFNF
jgi:hypothetical protein